MFLQQGITLLGLPLLITTEWSRLNNRNLTILEAEVQDKVGTFFFFFLRPLSLDLNGYLLSVMVFVLYRSLSRFLPLLMT